MSRRSAILAVLFATGCSQWWTDVEDYDGDGYSVSAGDCHDKDPGLHPGVAEIWYDGIDQNCDGNDLDKDEDGHLSAAYGGDDCWDDQDLLERPLEYTTLSGWTEKTAAEVNPSAEETWYDGVDQNCDWSNDFDQDGDGYRTAFHADHGGNLGDDCIDGSTLDIDNPAGLPPEEVFPGAEEVWYDGTNADCDMTEAEWGDYDADGDGYPSGQHGDWEGIDEDCDDNDAERYPDFALEDPPYDCIDANCDGTDGDLDGDGYVLVGYEQTCSNWNDPAFFQHQDTGDCWDDASAIPDGYAVLNGFAQPSAAEVHPDAADIYYDGVDANCDEANEFDQDLDGFYTADYPNKYGIYGNDCEDDNDQVNPDQLEDCDTASDDDCNGSTNEINALNCDTYYSDVDQDGYGTSTTLCLCEAYSTFSATNADDCDDGEATTNPGADEYCDGHDDDCDGEIDEDDAVDVSTWYKDSDLDGYGDSTQTKETCYQEVGYVDNDLDCDDSDNENYPGADEYCDGDDNDCDGDTDENDAVDASVWYIDADADSYGSDDSIAVECNQPSGYVLNNDDCDDGDAGINPTAAETSNEVDDNCDDRIDEGYRSYGVFYLTEISTLTTGAEPEGEWFELYNPGGSDVYLDGVEVDSNCNSSASGFVLGVDGVVLPAGGYAVFCHDDEALGSLCDYVYGSDNNGVSKVGATYSEGFCLDEGGDTLTISLAGSLIDDLIFENGVGGWRTHLEGVSLILHSGYYGANANGTATNWCYPGSSESFGSSTTGNGNPGAGMLTCNGAFPNGN